ncbi:hypothetical protein OnM2_044057 [Erysiphe neolycopersici]|uniref:Uncharacterized protein n=1 Tax=Erysiphe neolycopersici TaxID=212602 RepID=A0A420HUY2_9PEZI|nr:hypothetical protein OnM2_044057 [Erysiphe neolycopersici]
MGLPVFKTPDESGITATTLEKSLSNARSSIRRNRPCESRDLSGRTSSNSRRGLGIDAIFDPRDFCDDEDEDETRRRINEYYNARNFDSPSALWNSRVIRIFNDNRERFRHRESLESEQQYFPFYDNTSDYEPTEHSRGGETAIQPTQPHRARLRRLRRMTGRHSLLSRPVLYSDSFPRLAPPTSIVDTSSLTMDARDQENYPAQSQLQDPGLDINQIAVIRSRNESSDAIQPISAAVEISQNRLESSTPTPWQERLDQASMRYRGTSSLSESVWENSLGGIPEHRPIVNILPDPVNYYFRDSSPSLSETTVSDKHEGPQQNLDFMPEGRRDNEIETARLEISENRGDNRLRTYADVVATRYNIFNQHDIVISNRFNI